jgi:hypothetical protein
MIVAPYFVSEIRMLTNNPIEFRFIDYINFVNKFFSTIFFIATYKMQQITNLNRNFGTKRNTHINIK